MAVATYEDVAVALGRPISSQDEQAQVEHWLTGVELILWARLGDLSALDQARLLFVEAEAVAAKVERRAAKGMTSMTVNVDDGGVTHRYSDKVTEDDITDAWWDLLLGRVSTRGTARMGWLA